MEQTEKLNRSFPFQRFLVLTNAHYTMFCLFVSLVLLASSLISQYAGFDLMESLGALGLIYF